LTVPVLNVVGGGVDQLVEQKCKQNIACCQNTHSEAVCVFPEFPVDASLTHQQNGNLVGVAAPCVALGSLL
jgi:hypothetical protein